MSTLRKLNHSIKRGDTIIEVMFAFAVFSLVAIITITMMDRGLSAAERSLEITTVRNEVNAQAEALRFIHSSYIAESSLPAECDDINGGKKPKCQQFTALWKAIIEKAVDPANFSLEMPVTQCNDSDGGIYHNNASLLSDNAAFVLNTRRIISTGDGTHADASAYISSRDGLNYKKFIPPSLTARIVFSKDGSIHDNNSANGVMHENGGALSQYTQIASAEGIWVIAVKEQPTNPRYYDFHIGSCWYAPGSNNAMTVDTIVRLYNPGN